MIPYCDTCGSSFQTAEELSQHFCVYSENQTSRESSLHPFARRALLYDYEKPTFHRRPLPSPSESSSSRTSFSDTLTPTIFETTTFSAESSVSDKQRRSAQSKCEKGQLQRDCQALYLQDLEDIFDIMCGINFSEKRQSQPNQVTSGLTTTKEEICRITVTLLLHMINPMYVDAVKQGTLEQFRVRMSEIVDRGRCLGRYPSKDTVIDDGDVSPCRRNKGNKEEKGTRECITHRHSDWVVCRKDRRRALLKFNEAKLMRNGHPASSRTTRL